MGTYIRVKRSSVPKGVKILSTCMVYKIKKDLASKVLRYKARCVAMLSLIRDDGLIQIYNTRPSLHLRPVQVAYICSKSRNNRKDISINSRRLSNSILQTPKRSKHQNYQICVFDS